MKKNQTRRALLMSVLSLLLCCSMLVGTTFAWFTDTVESGKNQIIAGNLDIELEYAKVENGNITGWDTVSGKTNIFDPNALWEPGRVEVVYLKVSNLGTLALKYHLGVNVSNELPGTNVNNETFLLSNHLVFKVVEMPDGMTTYTDREAVKLAAGTEKGLKDYNGNVKALDPKDGTNDEDYVALIVYMPTTVGNEANYKNGTAAPVIELGINLFATQQTAEEDSFDELYDKNAIIVNSAADAQAALDAAEAGMTIQMVPGVNYGTLYLRPSANNPATKEVDWIGNNYRYETYSLFEGITIKGASNATVDAIVIEGGTYYNTAHSQAATYPIMLSLIELKDVVIDGVTFTGKGGYDPQGHGNAINLSGNNIKVDGLTIKNCVLSDVSNNARLLYKTESTTSVHNYTYGGEDFTFVPSLKDITVTGTTFNGGYIGLELRETENVTITNNIFNVADRNILLPVNTGCAYSGNVTITGNVSNNAKERFVRADGMGDAVVVIKDNILNSYMGEDVDYIKVTNANNVTIENNSVHMVWSGVVPTAKPETLVVDTANKMISVNSIPAFAYLNTLLNDPNFATTYGPKWQYSVELNVDVDLANREWTPIVMSNFIGFDGNGHTISNLKITSGKDNVGLFGAISCNDLGYCTVKDLTIDGAYVKGGNLTGVLVGSGNCTAENVTVLNATIEAGKYVGGLAGRISSVKNCTIKNSAAVATNKTVGGLVGYCIVDPGTGVAIGNKVEDVKVTGAYNVGGMFGQAQNVTVDSNTVKNVTVTSTTALPADASSNEVRTAAVAARSAFAGTTIGTNTVENVTCAIEVYGLTLIPNGENSKIIVNDKEGFLNLTKLFADWTELFTDGNGTTFTNYANGAGADYYYSGRWTVSLEADIDLNNATISPVVIKHPVSAGNPTFDGNGKTIKNAKIVTNATTENEAGLFNASSIAFKNLKLDNIHVTGSNVGNSTAGVLAGSCSFPVDNITITNSSVTGGKYTGGVVGYGYTDVLNCTLTNVTVKGGYKLGGLIGYICASGTNTGDVSGNTLTDCTVDGIGGGVYAGGKTEYVIGKLVGNYNCDGTCNNNTITNMTTSATENIGKIEAGKTVTQ